MTKASAKKRYRKLEAKIRKLYRQWDKAVAECEKRKEKLDNKFGALVDRYDAQAVKVSKKM